MASAEFEGWLGLDKSAAKGNMKWGKFEPKKWAEDDVDIQISHCGVCGSDLHARLPPAACSSIHLLTFILRL